MYNATHVFILLAFCSWKARIMDSSTAMTHPITQNTHHTSHPISHFDMNTFFPKYKHMTTPVRRELLRNAYISNTLQKWFEIHVIRKCTIQPWVKALKCETVGLCACINPVITTLTAIQLDACTRTENLQIGWPLWHFYRVWHKCQNVKPDSCYWKWNETCNKRVILKLHVTFSLLMTINIPKIHA